ncbi:MAG: anti-sigma B factor antagonist [Candidatus Marinamargulisbacteria bacterium]|jgi:anti-sigma B factor antagonist
MAINFSVKVEKKDLPVVRVEGEIDIYTCPDLQTVFGDLITGGHDSFILDLENIQYIDSTGLGTIAAAANELMVKNGSIKIICNKPQIKKIFEVSGLQEKNITLFEDEVSALSNQES